MNYCSFLSALLDEGRVTLADAWAPSEQDILAGDQVLTEFEQRYRLELAGHPPEVSLLSARWAGTTFFRACQFVLFRDVDAPIIRRELSAVCPQPPSPAVHYSVDLVFRFLPDLVALARTAAVDDPLVEHLLWLAQRWPLSSIGISGVGNVECSWLASDSCLLALYVDRVLTTSDNSRLAEPTVRDGIRQALGLHTELSTKMNDALQEIEFSHD